MPVTMPTPEELRQLTPSQQAKIRRAIWRILTETDHVANSALVDVLPNVAFGEAVMAAARDLEARAPRDPDHITRDRQRALMEAIR